MVEGVRRLLAQQLGPQGSGIAREETLAWRQVAPGTGRVSE